jgi:hypothetical protein
MRMNMARNRPMRRASSRRSGGQPVDQDRDEDDVVDAQHQLERGEGDERDPGLRIEQQLHARSVQSRGHFGLNNQNKPWTP